MVLARDLKIPAARGRHPDLCKGSIFFVGTATTIIRHMNFTILTDPNFLHAGDHIHVRFGQKSERLTDPAIEIEELPPIDFVLLSHHHEDHFDRIAAERLDKDIPVFTTPQAANALAEKGFRNLTGLGKWDTARVTKGKSSVFITAMPAKHGPGLMAAPAMGELLRFGGAGGNRFSLYISGDTLLFPELKEIPKRYPGVDLALLHLGGAKLLNLIRVTLNAKEGVEVLRIVRPRAAVPIHYNDYTLYKSSLEDFREAAEKAEDLETEIVYLSHGESYEYLTGECEVEAA